MRVELWVPTATPISTPELLAFIGREAEARGFSCLWVGEHVVLFEEYASSYPYADDGKIPAPPGSGLLEPLTTLSFLAAHTSTVRLGTAMVLLPQRNPVYTAKDVATLDWLSGGRVDLGIGVGWLEEEFRAVNVPWPQRVGGPTSTSTSWPPCGTTRRRPSRASSTRSTPCQMFPKPVQHRVPIHIGGESDAALRPRGPGRRRLAHLQPGPRGPGRAPGHARRLPGRPGSEPIGHHRDRVPLLPAPRRRHRRPVRRGRCRRRGRTAHPDGRGLGADPARRAGAGAATCRHL